MSGRSQQIEDEALRWLMRREEANWSAEQAAGLDQWLALSTAHRVAFLRMEHGWERSERLAALRSPEPPATVRPRRPAWRPAAIAAGLALTVVAGGLAINQGWIGLGRKTYVTQVGGHSTAPLPDGSRIELNTDSRLRAEIDDKRRLVWLDRGEAFFDVARDPSRPFVVRAGDRRITVLGTKFAVRRRPDGQVVVNVLEGRVRVERATNRAETSPPAIVLGGGRLVAKAEATLLAPQATDRVSSDLAWRRGLLVFDQTTLGEAAAEFNRYNHRKIVVSDPAIAAMRIGGSFDAQNVDAFIRLLSDGFGLVVENGGDGEVQISG